MYNKQGTPWVLGQCSYLPLLVWSFLTGSFQGGYYTCRDVPTDIHRQAPEPIHRNVHVYTENCCLMHTPGLRPLFTRMDKVSIQYLVATWLIGFYSGDLEDLDLEFFGE